MELLGFEISKSGKEPYEWEKHGSNLYTTKSVVIYPNIRQTTNRIINRINKFGGKIFYHGREKISGTEEVNPNGLYKTVFSDAIRKLDAYCAEQQENFVIVVDEHSARKELLETAVKTMYGRKPTVHLASPPFEVESHLNQNIQAADWIAAIIGKLWTYRFGGAEWADLKPYEDYFWSRIHAVTSHSTVLERQKRLQSPVEKEEVSATAVISMQSGNTAFAAAFHKASLKRQS